MDKVDIRGRALALIFAALTWLAPFAAFAQSSVERTLPGTFTSGPCPGGGQPCWKPSASASASVPINISTNATTQLVAASSGQGIYVSHWDVIAGGTGGIQLEYGTGASCGTGTTAITGSYPLTAQNGLAAGNGTGAILFVPAGNALCAVTTAAVQMSGSLSYTQY